MRTKKSEINKNKHRPRIKRFFFKPLKKKGFEKTQMNRKKSKVLNEPKAK